MDAHLRDLRYFATVADELSFTRAAERLYVSQPALSKQIRRLETDLRVPLFERDGRGVRLTAAGAALLPAARNLLRDWAEAQRVVSDAAAAAASVLTVGVSTSVGRGLFQRARDLFAERRPGWRLAIRQIDWDDPSAGLAGGDTDVSLVWLPIPDRRRYGVRVVATEPRWVAFRDDHRLAGRDRVDFAELLGEPLLALPEDSGPLREYWLGEPDRAGAPVRIGAVVANADETFAAIEDGSGIVLLAEGNAAIYHRPGIRAVPVDGLSPAELAVIWNRADHRPAVRDFVDAVTPP
ncbi:LysR family transcriptional regulator [Nocardia sp. BMG111209]|uniref:LysR family transcriptional regulator n=1 Tax=Nocardia sp. BMG111209 TaxID=1160137 RepID=UPI00036DD68A|nr:LysR family transcriptional regulator [Nocardia sp. BMG111209]